MLGGWSDSYCKGRRFLGDDSIEFRRDVLGLRGGHERNIVAWRLWKWPYGNDNLRS